MSEEDLERYESEIELALVHEYRAVLPLFSYVVETERRFYLANQVDVTVRSDTSPACVEVVLNDAWVWDMYRPARFVPRSGSSPSATSTSSGCPKRTCEPAPGRPGAGRTPTPAGYSVPVG